MYMKACREAGQGRTNTSPLAKWMRVSFMPETATLLLGVAQQSVFKLYPEHEQMELRL